MTLEPLSTSHAGQLWGAAQSADTSWAYLRYGPFASEAELSTHIDQIVASRISRSSQSFLQ